MQQPQMQKTPPEQQMPPGQDAPAEEMGMEDDEPLDDGHPVFVAALDFAMKALYESGAARGVADSLESAPSPSQGLSDVSYQIIEIVGERIGEELPEELLPLLAIAIMQEVAEIGEAAGVAYQPSDLAEAFKAMILRFLREQGLDSSELEAAMAQVDPSVFNSAGAEK